MMKTLLFICGLAIAAGSPAWENFKSTHGKSYINAKEELYRKSIFEENLKQIEEHNKLFRQGLVTFDLKMNKFGDMKNEEFASHMKGLKMVERKEGEKLAHFPEAKRADSVDWRDKGAVTPVKDMSGCDCTWAFSATGSIEGMHFLKKGQLVSMSEQNLVDCVTENNGCLGGDVQTAFDYVISNKGIDTEDSYPYEGWDLNTCRFDSSYVAAKIHDYVNIESGDEVTQAQAVHDVGPVSVAIDAAHFSLQFYTSGVYYEPNCDPSKANHAMLAVGYGTEEGTDYWLLKNSWGAEWGESGYLKLTRNQNNHCGIASKSLYPIV